ncbi:MAG: protein TolQ [Pseudomonadota bacterium]|nr:protein TolQ [Pseudomonadota bacterium]
MNPMSSHVTAADLSMLSLFFQADIVVKIVVLLLLLASIWCWAIIIDKIMAVRRLKRKADAFEESFWSGGSLDDLFDRVVSAPSCPMAATFVAGMNELRHASGRGLGGDSKMTTSVRKRVERSMSVTIGREMDRAERYLVFLASVGSTAPFVGLFGTVWGIMNSFTAIAATAQTNLAIVAPGIAEALFATALGLVAAIPAVLAYNKFSSDLGRYAARLEAFSEEFGAILWRHLEDKT